jgi:hypothetical protein
MALRASKISIEVSLNTYISKAMYVETIHKAKLGTLRQLSIYADNKVGKLHEMTRLLASQGLHIMAISVLDNTDSAMIRMIVNYTGKAIEVLTAHKFTFGIVEVLGLEIQSEVYIDKALAALTEAEINIDYVYPFLMRPEGQSGLVLRLEDIELASAILSQRGFKVLDESDIAR